MGNQKVYRAIGLMSGTSLDGVDAALVETDGHDFVHPTGFFALPYEAELREQIRGCLGKQSAGADVIQAITTKHIEAVKGLVAQEKVALEDVEVIGFHGQTIYHNPAQKITVQIGDARLMAAETGVPVVADFRTADVKAGGQGAPFLPLYHQARVKADNLKLPVAVLNIGGVANVTWVADKDVLAFDTGPGNALIDDWVSGKTGADYDPDGALANAGKINKEKLAGLMANSYFVKQPPKSLDRDHWDVSGLKDLSVEDGAATLAAFTVEAVKRGAEFFAEKPRQWLVTGGGRHNKFLMDYLRITLNAPVNPVENQGWNGDALEAEGFAYLAVRSLLGLPVKFADDDGRSRAINGWLSLQAMI